jgi:hypothetical protein
LSWCLTYPALAQTTGPAQISWEVANRFRLFAEQKDFDPHVAAWQSENAGAGKSILGAERALEKPIGGAGWAVGTVGRLCYERTSGQVPRACARDGATENYLNPESHLIVLRVGLPPEFSAALCTWTIGEAPGAKTIRQPCSQAVSGQRVPNKVPTPVSVAAKTADGQTLATDTTVMARDYLIVGLGDSIASGDGNPDQPIALSASGFCFRRVLEFGQAEFYLPGRAKATVATDCEDENPNDRQLWDLAAAGWLYTACHRSLYNYQLRAALGLAVANPNISVTFIPLGCTGASIHDGMLFAQEAREKPPGTKELGPLTVPAQLDQLAGYLGAAGRTRSADLIFLTIGANDIQFSNLVADVIVTGNPDRNALIESRLLSSPNEEQTALKVTLRNDFTILRERLAPFVGGNLQRVVFVTYADPAQHQGGICPSSRVGFDAHPAFSVDGAELKNVVNFVEKEFLPTLKSYATCEPGGGCSDPARQRMTFVADHQTAFLRHGFCAADETDPAFDRACFRNGGSFAPAPTGLSDPLACPHYVASQFRPYAERARWVRTANDSYFAAMTYPQTARGFLDNPTYIHDGRWGLTSVVYGGVMHPTAEGHAAMADAALAAASTVLNLPNSAGAVSAK